MRGALLFDLDETLIVEEPAAAASFEAAARFAATRSDIDVGALALAARSRARELWRAAPTSEYCRQIGISSWEGLWCRFEGEDPEICALRDWSPAYRRETWRLALADQGVEAKGLAEELGERFAAERRARHEVFPDAEAVLAELKGSYALALVTNGASCLQREKLAASRLATYFDAVVVSGEFGVGKPDASIFGYALSRLGAEDKPAAMVGDSLSRDVDGAIAAGLDGVWVNRARRSRPVDRHDLIEISRLSPLPEILAGLSRFRQR
jgi:putative hydrolase of the HAD superfamily